MRLDAVLGERRGARRLSLRLPTQSKQPLQVFGANGALFTGG